MLVVGMVVNESRTDVRLKSFVVGTPEDVVPTVFEDTTYSCEKRVDDPPPKYFVVSPWGEDDRCIDLANIIERVNQGYFIISVVSGEGGDLGLILPVWDETAETLGIKFFFGDVTDGPANCGIESIASGTALDVVNTLMANYCNDFLYCDRKREGDPWPVPYRLIVEPFKTGWGCMSCEDVAVEINRGYLILFYSKGETVIYMYNLTAMGLL